MVTNKFSKIVTKILLVILMTNLLICPQIINAQGINEALPHLYKEKSIWPNGIGGNETQEIKSINQQIEDRKDKINQLQEQISEYQKNIDYQKRQSLSLSNQLSILNNEINQIEAEIELKQNEIEKTELEIKDTQNKIQETEQNIVNQKSRLANFLRNLNKLDQKTLVEIILSTQSFSEYYNHLHTLEIFQNKTNQILAEIKEFKANLEVHVADLDKKKNSLQDLLTQLDDKKIKLESRSYAKQSLLIESRNSEIKFKSLVDQLKTEQSNINADIIGLEKKIREKLAKDRSMLDVLGGHDFSWPVPSREITAYFHDPTYPFRYIFEHPAIDIKSPQGSPVKAATNGYVGQIREAGLGYNYIMLIHADGFSTVYGHVSKILVEPDQFVTQGEVIGLSGGMPGTPGAGRLSTGPHLHFEIRLNGIPVNPLEYL